jgi:hypothetical protein
MKLPLFILLVLMFVGYGTVETGKYLRGRERRSSPAYPAGRLALRLFNTLLLLVVSGFVLLWQEPWGEGTMTTLVLPGLLLVLMVLVAIDLGWVAKQFRAETSRREAAFLRELKRALSGRGKPGST